MNLHLETDDDPRTRQFIDEHNALSDAALKTPRAPASSSTSTTRFPTRR
ncbi:MAG: hypothetical protein JF594_05225 [Rhizobium leguminosarum]|nr:hypothetical protein [Rhizobium leguminosarum]